jgi:hypothetical protein
MAMNLMGDFKRPNEQDLIADLVEEAIEQRGVPVRYILRDMLNPDELFGESSMSQFKDAYDLPMFLESVEHFNGNGDVFDEFGFGKVDATIFQVGSRRFRLELAESGIDRPREGDLIYMGMSDSLWTITKVKMDLKYYQVGKNYSYRLVCKLFNYSHEEIENPESDFNELTTVGDLDDEGIKKLLGIAPARKQDESEAIQDVIQSSIPVQDDETFGF